MKLLYFVDWHMYDVVWGLQQLGLILGNKKFQIVARQKSFSHQIFYLSKIDIFLKFHLKQENLKVWKSKAD